MPFCTQCGGEVKPSDVYCGHCGARQTAAAGFAGAPAGGAPPHGGAASGPFAQLTPHNAAVLCYVPWLGWIASIVILATERFRQDRTVRFHAFQGLYLFVLWLFVDWVFSPLAQYAEVTRGISSLFKLAVLGVWIFMIVKTSQKALVRLPLLGELAERSVAEQK